MAEYRQLKENEINAGLLDGFIRRQVVTKCLRRENGAWIAKNAPFIDDWTQKDREWIAADLKNLAGRGGLVYAAYCGGKLAGFASVSAETLGESGEYLELTNIHVTEAMRGRGIGRALFYAAAEWAKAHGAKKLYISAHSSVESQAFYNALGCTDAELYSPRHIEAEPCDRQMEYSV